MKNFIEVTSNKKSLLINVEAIALIEKGTNNDSVIYLSVPVRIGKNPELTNRLVTGQSYECITQMIKDAVG